MENAERYGNLDLAKACKHRLYELAGLNIDDPFERRFAETLAAYEEALRTKHGGRNTPATWTRQMLKNKGAHYCVVYTINRPNPDVTLGFGLLVENGDDRYTAEYLAVEFADRFTPDVVETARQRLAEYGIEVSK